MLYKYYTSFYQGGMYVAGREVKVDGLFYTSQLKMKKRITP
jgi:hypothetical protein